MSRRLFHGQLAESMAEGDRQRAERLRLLARSLIDIVRDALQRHGMVRIHGFGTFRVVRTRARRGINPQTGEPIEIPARNRVLFRPAKALRERVEPGNSVAVPLAEPHESREARLGGSMADTPVAGGLPAPDNQRSSRYYFPDRVAAAAMAETTARVTASAHDTAPPGAGGSREANLGGVMADSPHAGRVVTTESGEVSRPAETSTRPAANEDAMTRASREARLGGGATRLPTAGGLPEEGAPDVDTSQARAAPSVREAYGPEESGSAPAQEDSTQAESAEEVDFPVFPESTTGERVEPEHEDRRPLLLLGLILLVALLLGLGWWLWPAPEPLDRVAADTAIETERTDVVVTDTPADGDQATATGSAATAEATEEPPVDAVAAAPEVTEPTPTTTEPSAEAEASAGAADTATSQSASDSTEAAETGGTSASVEAQTGAPEPAARTTVGAEDAPAGGTDEAMAEAEASQVAAAETAGSASAGTPWFSGREHTVASGDTLWDLSDRNYVNPYYWPHIWNHNESLPNPDRIEIDQILWLPALQGEPRALTAADRRSIAEGYLRLYRLWKDIGAANPQYALVGVRYFDPEVMPPELQNDPSAGRPGDALAAAFEAMLQAEFPIRR